MWRKLQKSDLKLTEYFKVKRIHKIALYGTEEQQNLFIQEIEKLDQSGFIFQKNFLKETKNT